MNAHAFKPLLAALLLAGSCAAQAAHFEVTGYQVFGAYTDYAGFDHYATDLSQDGQVGIFGSASATDETFGYAVEGYLLNGKELGMTNSQFFTGASGTAHSGDALLALPGITLKVVGDGEAAGTDVRVSFAGTASIINALAGTNGSVYMDLAVTRGGATLGSFLWDSSAETGPFGASRNVGFSFLAKVGEEISLGGTLGTTLTADGSQSGALASTAGSLLGDFTVAAVPEPQQYALFLAGFALVGLARRRSGH